MKSTVIIGAAAAVFIPADAFLLGGSAASTTLLAQPMSVTAIINNARAAAHGGSCGCPLCTTSHGRSCRCASCTASHGRSCGCPSCSAGVVAGGRTYGAVRMMAAHPQGCGCGECSSPSNASAVAHAGSCACSTCVSSRGSGRGRRGASTLTVLMATAGVEDEGAGGLRKQLANAPESVMFADVMEAIAESYDYSPKRR